MRKSTAALAALAATLTVAPALAAPPADQDACNKLAYSYAEKAAGQKLPEAQAIKVDELIGKLEGQCSESKFAEAEATAKEIDALLK